MSARRCRHGYRRSKGSVEYCFLSYKAERAVKTILEVNPRRTTQEGYKYSKEAKKKFGYKNHKYPYCELKMDRDSNSSFIVLEKRFRRSDRQGTVRIYAYGDRTSTKRNLGKLSC